jgi:hypothetical protein
MNILLQIPFFEKKIHQETIKFEISPKITTKHESMLNIYFKNS